MYQGGQIGETPKRVLRTETANTKAAQQPDTAGEDAVLDVYVYTYIYVYRVIPIHMYICTSVGRVARRLIAAHVERHVYTNVYLCISIYVYNIYIYIYLYTYIYSSAPAWEDSQGAQSLLPYRDRPHRNAATAKYRRGGRVTAARLRK